MACGWTPDLMRMLESMADEKQRLATQATQELQQTKQQVEAIKKRSTTTTNSPSDSSHYDWTSVYGKWDAYEDPEELAHREQLARDKQDRAAKAASSAGCNHDHSAEQKLMDMTTDDKLRACDEFRLMGNAFFGQGQYQRAAYNYHKALVYFEYIFPETEDGDAKLESLKLTTLVNFTACRLKTGHIDDAIHHADLALAISPHNVKALYRRAQAYRLRDEFEKAQVDLSVAMLCSGEDTETGVDPMLVQEKQLLQAKMLAYKLKSRQISAAMFGGAAAAGGGGGADKTKDPPIPRATFVRDVPLKLMTGSVLTQEEDEWQLDESWRPLTSGLHELQQLLETL